MPATINLSNVPIKETGIRQTFEQARADFRGAVEAWRQAMEVLRDAQLQLREAEREMVYREAELRFEPTVAGKNAEERAASLLTVCASDKSHQANAEKAELARQEVQRWTDEANEAKERIALAKRVMDFTTAWLRFRTTEEETNGHR